MKRLHLKQSSLRGHQVRRGKKSGFTLMEVVVGSSISAVVLSFALGVFLTCMSSWATGEAWIQAENDTRQSMRIINDELREAMWVSVDADGMGITYRKPEKDSGGLFKIPVTWDGQDRRIYYSNGTLVMQQPVSSAVASNNGPADKPSGMSLLQWLKLQLFGGGNGNGDGNGNGNNNGPAPTYTNHSRTICRNVMTTNPFASANYASAERKVVNASASTGPSYRIFTPNAGGIVNEVTVEIITGYEGAKDGEELRSRRREIVTLRNVPELIK